MRGGQFSEETALLVHVIAEVGLGGRCLPSLALLACRAGRFLGGFCAFIAGHRKRGSLAPIFHISLYNASNYFALTFKVNVADWP